jgi:hypothetical protein
MGTPNKKTAADPFEFQELSRSEESAVIPFPICQSD